MEAYSGLLVSSYVSNVIIPNNMNKGNTSARDLAAIIINSHNKITSMCITNSNTILTVFSFNVPFHSETNSLNLLAQMLCISLRNIHNC